MTTTNPTRQQAYEARVKTFAENKTFQYLTSIKVKRGNIKCDACGSKLVKELRLIQDNQGNYYLVGINCHTVLYNEQKMYWGVYPHNPQESQKIAERLVAERKGCNEFYPLQCTGCGCEISETDAIRSGHRCESCWYIFQQE